MYKLTATGVLLEDKWIPNAPGNTDWEEYQAWLLIEGNIPDPEFSEDEQRANKIKEIKTEAYANIIRVADDIKQRNMLATALYIVNKKVDGITLSPDELTTLANIQAVWGVIENERAISNDRETKVLVAPIQDIEEI
jgi:hypothetical protein